MVSDDPVQDTDSVHKVKELVDGYLKNICSIQQRGCMSSPMGARSSISQDNVLVTCLVCFRTLDIQSRETTLRLHIQRGRRMHLVCISITDVGSISNHSASVSMRVLYLNTITVKSGKY